MAAVEQWKNSILLQIVKATESSDCDFTCHMFSFEDTVGYVAISNLNGILTIEI